MGEIIPTKNITWSYSAIKAFETCPRQFYHLRVAKDYKDSGSPATVYGEAMHKAAELYIGNGEELPKEFLYLKPLLDKLAAFPGDKLCEYKMALTMNLEPCEMFSPDAWWRGIADLLIVDGGTARCIDYKSSKSAKFADKGQLELMALAVFRHFPDVKVVKGGLLFPIANGFIKETYSIDQEGELWHKWLSKYRKVLSAYKNDVWNPKPSGLCKRYCVVTGCEHNGG
jgi:RecB family exonuclease